MRNLLLLAALVLPASSVAQPAPSQREHRAARPVDTADKGARLDCIANRVRHADAFGNNRLRRLDELPKGELYLSVVRDVDGCQELVLVSEERARSTQRR
jgi:hypothetical protein